MNWNLYKFCNISVNFEDSKMIDHILKISRLGIFDFRCLSWNTAIIVFMKKCRMDRRRYESRHWIPMFIGKHTYNNTLHAYNYYLHTYTYIQLLYTYVLAHACNYTLQSTYVHAFNSTFYTNSPTTLHICTLYP